VPWPGSRGISVTLRNFGDKKVSVTVTETGYLNRSPPPPLSLKLISGRSSLLLLLPPLKLVSNDSVQMCTRSCSLKNVDFCYFHLISRDSLSNFL